MRARHVPLAAAILALAACAPTDVTSPDGVAVAEPRLDQEPPPWGGWGPGGAPYCPTMVTFNPLGVGALFGVPAGQFVTDPAFIEAGVRVTNEDVTTPGGAVLFDRSEIQPAPAGIAFGDGNIVRHRDKGFLYEPKVGGPYFDAYFEFAQMGGVANVAVNGGAPFIGNLPALPAALGGCAVTVGSAAFAGGVEGMVHLSCGAPIMSLEVGGRDLAVDNVCFR